MNLKVGDAAIWTTAAGEHIPIKRLSDSHLSNIIEKMKREGWLLDRLPQMEAEQRRRKGEKTMNQKVPKFTSRGKVNVYFNPEKGTTVIKERTKNALCVGGQDEYKVTKVKTSCDDTYDAKFGFLLAYFEHCSGLTKTQAHKYLESIIPMVVGLEAELAPEPEEKPCPAVEEIKNMTKQFKVGDKVKITDTMTFNPRYKVGDTGVVLEVLSLFGRNTIVIEMYDGEQQLSGGNDISLVKDEEE